MINSISGRADRVVYDKPRQMGPLTQEDIEQRALNREIMKRLDFKAVKSSMAEGRRRFTDSHIAQNGLSPRPGALIAHSESQQGKIISILEDLRNSAEEGSLRMSLIDKMLAEFGAGKADIDATQDHAAYVELSEGAKNASKAAKDPKAATGTLPFKVTPPAEHPVIAKMKEDTMANVLRVHAELNNGKPSNVPSDWVMLDASGDLEFYDSGLRVNMDKMYTSGGFLDSARFRDGTVENFISSALSEKMGKAEANLIALEIGNLVLSASLKNGDYLEDRAISRELGLRLAEHYANAYIDDPDEANSFIETIRGFAERDEMLDKGYQFWEGEAYEAYKPHPLSIAWKRGLNWSDKEMERMASEFADNEEKTEEIMANAAATVSNKDVAKLLRQVQEKLSNLTYAYDESTYKNEDMQWIRDLYLSSMNNSNTYVNSIGST